MTPRMMAAALLFAGCGAAPVEGTVVDGLTGAPVAELRVLARAAPDQGASLTCSAFEAKTDAAGHFTLPGLCSGVAYQLEDGDGTYWFADFAGIPASGGPEKLDLKGWPAPNGVGAYTLDGTTLSPIRSTADLRSEEVGEAMVYYPKTLKGRVEVVGAGQYLVLAGDMKDYSLEPLIESPAKDWSYIGVRFTDEAVFEAVPNTADLSKRIDKIQGDRAVTYLPQSAVGDGRYVLYDKEGGRLFMMDFGRSFAPATSTDEG